MPGRRRLVTVLAAAGLLAGCGIGEPPFTPPPPPSEEAALRHLADVVAIVESGDISGICRLGAGTCSHDLRGARPQAVPHSGPVILGSRVIASEPAQGGGWHIGGVLLELCGRDGLGKRYSSQMLVYNDHRNQLVSINTLYWLGIGIATSNLVVPDRRPVGDCPEG
jgi:hypothetical protein